MKYVFVTGVFAAVLAIAGYSYFGITSWPGLRKGLDASRSTTSLRQEHEDLTVAKAADVQGMAFDQRRVDRDITSTEQQLQLVDQELAESLTKVGFMTRSYRDAENGKVFVGKVQLNQLDVKKDLEAAVEKHRQLESRKSRLTASIALLKRSQKALQNAVTEGRAELTELRSKDEMLKLAESLPTVTDPNTIEGEILRCEERTNEIESELERRGISHAVVEQQKVDLWGPWSKGSSESEAILAEAEAILRASNVNSQSSVTQR